MVTHHLVQDTSDGGACYGEKPSVVGTGSARGGRGMRLQGNIEQNPKGGGRANCKKKVLFRGHSQCKGRREAGVLEASVATAQC